MMKICLGLAGLTGLTAVAAADQVVLSGEHQVLEMSAMKPKSKQQIASFSKVCPDDELSVVIDYATSDNEPTSALSFKIQFEHKFLNVVDAPSSTMALDDCPIAFVSEAIKLDAHLSYVTMVCADMGSKKVVPAKQPGVLAINFKVKPNTGGGMVNIVMLANPKLSGVGYKYKEVRPKKTLKVLASCDRDEL